MSTAVPSRHKVVIVGGGFGGVRAARLLARHQNISVTLISAEETFAYYPQLYHAATGGARAGSALPLTGMLAGLPVTVVRDTITTFDPRAHTITGASGTTYEYDDLILALGNVTNYFGIQGLSEFSYDIKSIAGAERFKQHLHKELVEDKKPDPNYVVVGGGPTGVELAAALGEYLRRITHLHGLDRPKYSIKLVEAAPRLLPRLSEDISARVQRQLEAMGVQVMTGATVLSETAAGLRLQGETLATKTVVWTAGVSNNPFFKDNAAHFNLAKNGKVEVDEHLQAAPSVYVIGDNAATPYSGMAQTAVSDAGYVASDIVRTIAGRSRPAYRPKAPVSVIPAGTYWAAVQWGPVRLYGLIGYILRRAADLIGYAEISGWLSGLRAWLKDGHREDNCAVCAPPS